MGEQSDKLSGRGKRRSAWLGWASAALLLIGGAGPPTTPEPAGNEQEGTAMATRDGPKFEYGFRHDPMGYVEKDRSLHGAMVRTFVFEKPKRGDKGIIQAEIDKVLSKQLPDGRLSDDPRHSYQFTAEQLARLAEMGCPADRAEVKKAVAAILGKEKANEADPLGIYDVRALCLLGLAGQAAYRDVVRAGLALCMDREKQWSDLTEGCPWTPVEHLITLWHGRAQADTEATVVKALEWIADGLNGAGCLSFKDPWGFVRLASVVEHPLAGAVLAKEVPVLLRGQRADGGWGDRSFFVFRALQRHGLLDELRKAPPLPADWKVARSIPAPTAHCATLAWDGTRLWTRDGKTNEAIAVSVDHGKVVQRVKLPAADVGGIGWWDDGLAVTRAKAKVLVKVHPKTGLVERTIDLKDMEWINGVTQADGKLVVGDGFLGAAFLYDPAGGGEPVRRVLGGPIPADLAGDGATVWHVDAWAPALIRSDLGGHGRLVDWGEKPFDGRCEGIAFDGKCLWALDARGRRICALEKTPSAPKVRAPAAWKVRREADRVYIADVPRARGANSVLASLVAALRAAGEDLTYEYLMGVSGRAFRLQFNWCPSAPHSNCGFNTTAPALQAAGYGMVDYPLATWSPETRKQRPPTAAEIDAARAAVRQSIDAGMPVLFGSEEAGVIVGCGDAADGATGWLCRPGPVGPPPPADEPYLRPVKRYPWAVQVLQKLPAGPPPRRERIVWSLKTAVRNAHAARLGEGQGYAAGFAAWQTWIDELSGARKIDWQGRKLTIDELDKDQWFSACLGNAWCFESLIDARKAAAAYLRSVAGEFGRGAAGHLLAAAKAYEDLHKVLTPRCFTETAPYPWMIRGDRSKWPAKLRAEQAQLLRRGLALERKALAAIAAALAAEDAAAAPAEPPVKEVLLDKAVQAFNDLIGRAKLGHVVVAGEDGKEVYAQPPVYLTFHAVQMRASGWNVGYDDVAVASGASALFAYHPEQLEPKYCHVLVEPDRRIAEATGFGYEWVSFRDADDAWRIIRESVDSGRPCKGWDWEAICFAGYRDAPKREGRQVFAIADGPDTYAKWLTWEQFTEWAQRVAKWRRARLGRHTKRVRRAASKAVALRVLSDLAAWSVQPPEACRKRCPKAAFGLAGIEAYANDVADVAKKSKGYFKEGAWQACHAINPQWTIRNSTAVFLKRLAAMGTLPREANAHLLAAAGKYRAAYAAWKDFYGLLGHAAPKDAWQTKSRRAAGAAAVRVWLEQEKAALADVAAALTAAGVDVAGLGLAPPQEPAPPGPDYARLTLKGNGMEQDSFSLAVEAAARFLGKRPDYETICCLSTHAFAPAIDKGEDCTAWWHVQGWLADRCMPLVAGRIGLKARRLELPPARGGRQGPDAAAVRQRAWARIVREAMARGEVVLVTGGWQAKQAGRFVPWCWCGILTRADDDGTILGACLNGRKDNRIAGLDGGAWALSAAEPAIKWHEADLAMLTAAVARIRGSAKPFVEAKRAVYGLKAMDLWIARMRQKPFCVPCARAAPDRAWTCAHDNGNTMMNAAKVAASYLRKRKGPFGKQAETHVEAAAGHYERIARLLEPAVTGRGGPHYRRIIGNLAAQIVHAKLLEEVKAELAAAADEMEKALAAKGVKPAKPPAKPRR